MSERSIEEMMEMLRESDEVRFDLEKKSEEIKDNCRQRKVEDFLRVAAAIELAPEYARRRKFLGKYKVDKEPVLVKFYDLAHEVLDQDEIVYLTDIASHLSKAEKIFSNYYAKDSGLKLKSVFQAFLDKEIVLPTIKEFNVYKSVDWPGWDWSIIPGQLDFKSILDVLDKKLDSIHGRYSDLVNEGWGKIVNDERPNQYYLIAVDKIPYVASNFSYQAATSPHTYQETIKKEEDRVWEGIDDRGRAKIRGLTQVEYAALQIEKIIAQSDNLSLDISLYDGGTGKALLLGAKQFNDGDINAFITASWDGSTRTLTFSDDNRNGIRYYPRLSVGFDGFNKEPNE